MVCITRRASRRRPFWLLAALVGPAALPSTALAGSFDAGGRYVPDPAAVARDDFESYPSSGGAGGAAGAGGQTGGEKPDYTLVDDATALTGGKVLTMKANQQGGIGVTLPAADGSYVARLWVKDEVVATLQVEYGDGTQGLLSQLFPTGRSTSDGWFELESAPFSVEAAHQPDVGLGFFVTGDKLVADALEVVPGGEFRPVGRVCEGLGSEVCAADELCLQRRCVDGRGFVPPLPADEAGRRALATYLGNRLQFLFGPLRNRAEYMGDAMAAIESMKTETNRYRYWFDFVTAVQRLQDSHSTANGLFQFIQSSAGPGRIPLNVCFVNGDADLSHDQVPRDAQMPDVLVSHTGDAATWGLAPGDRLVAIDGQHPVSWARGLAGRSWSAQAVNDPASPAQHLEGLRGTIPSLARTITVIRCPDGVCGAPETLKVADQAIPEGPYMRVACDHRPGIHLADVPANHSVNEAVFTGIALESDATERIHGMVWDSLYGAGSDTGTAISAAVTTWETQGARGVILDHRTGNGGTKDAAMPILGFVSPTKYSEADVWRSFLDDKGPATLADGVTLFEKLKDDPSSLALVGSDSPSLDVPVALLLTRDVSASDYFPNAFKGSPNTRIFGPTPTNGAFSTFLQFSYWLGLSYQLAAQDTINHDGRMLCGHGVVPDEVVEPRQSDLTQGVDSVYAAALAWVRANLKAPEAP